MGKSCATAKVMSRRSLRLHGEGVTGGGEHRSFAWLRAESRDLVKKRALSNANHSSTKGYEESGQIGNGAHEITDESKENVSKLSR